MLKEGACDVWLQTSSIATAQAESSSAVDIIIAQGSGDFEEMCLAAGESAALVTTIGAAQAVVQTIAKKAEQILE
jgi:hypothetical protein